MNLIQAYETRREQFDQEFRFYTTIEGAKLLPSEVRYSILSSLEDLPEPTEESLTAKIGSTLYDLCHPVKSIKLIQLKENLESDWCNDQLYNN